MTPLQLTADLTIKAAAGKARRFTIDAYNGGRLVVAGFDLPIVVDLAGLESDGSNIPLLIDHESTVESTLGLIQSVVNTGHVLKLKGVVTGTSDKARGVLASHDAGHEWQASIGCSVEQQQEIPAGQTVSVNGQTFTGPLIIARRSVLKETSVLPCGADSSTQVNLAARAAILKGNTMPTTAPSASMSFDEWLTEHGIDPAKDMTPELIALLTPLYDSEQNGTQSPSPAAAAALVNLQAAANIDRIANINRIASGHPQIAAAAIRANWSALETENHVLKANQKMHAPSNHSRSGSSDGTTSDHLSAALMVRAGYTSAAEKQFGERVMTESRPLHGNSLVDMCRAALQADGRDIPAERGQMIRAALSTGSLPVALGDSANKILETAYRTAPASWRSFASVKSAANFKSQSGIRPSFGGDLLQLPPGGEIKHGTFAEEVYTWNVSTFAKMYQIDRTQIINDDASFFSDLVPGMARAAARTLNSLVATTLLANASSFFGTAHANHFEGSTTNLSATSLATAIQKLRQMKDAEGNLLDLAPAVLLVPPELEQIALALVNSSEVQRVATGDQQPTGNTLKDVAKVVVEPRLSDSSFIGYSQVGWYLFSDAMNSAVAVGFLDGKETPVLEQFGLDHDVNVLAYSFRTYHDFGVSLADYRAAIRSKGST